MAEKGMIFFYDWVEPLRTLDNKDFKELVLAMLDYHRYGIKNESLGGLAGMAAHFIYPQIDRMRASITNGKKGGRPRRDTEPPTQAGGAMPVVNTVPVSGGAPVSGGVPVVNTVPVSGGAPVADTAPVVGITPTTDNTHVVSSAHVTDNKVEIPFSEPRETKITPEIDTGVAEFAPFDTERVTSFSGEVEPEFEGGFDGKFEGGFEGEIEGDYITAQPVISNADTTPVVTKRESILTCIGAEGDSTIDTQPTRGTVTTTDATTVTKGGTTVDAQPTRGTVNTINTTTVTKGGTTVKLQPVMVVDGVSTDNTTVNEGKGVIIDAPPTKKG